MNLGTHPRCPKESVSAAFPYRVASNAWPPSATRCHGQRADLYARPPADGVGIPAGWRERLIAAKVEPEVIVAAPTDADEVRTLYEVTNRFWDAYQLHEPTVDAGRRANNHRDTAAQVLGYQIAELGCAAADEFKHPRPTAGAVVGRALMEAVLTLRWCLKSDDHALRWWLDGDAAIQKLARQTALSDDALSEALRKEKVRKPTVPGMQRIAHEVGCDRLYELFYHLFSQYAHGVRSAAHHMFVSPKSDGPLPLPIRPVIFLVGDAGCIYETWAVKRVLAPPQALPPRRFG